MIQQPLNIRYLKNKLSLLGIERHNIEFTDLNTKERLNVVCMDLEEVRSLGEYLISIGNELKNGIIPLRTVAINPNY